VDGVSCANIQKAQDLLQYSPYMTTLQSHSVNRTIQWHYEQSSLDLTVESHLPLPIEVTENVPIERMNPQIQIPLMDASGDHLTSDIVVTVAAVNSNVTKLCPTGVIVLLSNHPNYPRWLRQLALMQWLIVVVILLFRFTCRVRGGGIHRITSSSTLLSLQQPPLQQLICNNMQTKEGRASPRRERV
jgi:hypothetical protein